MQAHVHELILKITRADTITNIDMIQPLWNHYGTLSRVSLIGGDEPSVIVKHIKVPKRRAHPQGFASDLSHQRKMTSYQVELSWYTDYNHHVPDSAPTPRCLGATDKEGELFLLLEDLTTQGFDQVLHHVSWHEITLVLTWLARFHAHFMGTEPHGLWPRGTYWHLSTRPEELARIEGTRVHRFAAFLDARLGSCGHQTLVHGDAKLANFCFSQDHTRVAAVDFQYVGRGCGIKDVAYFVGSCLSEAECLRLESEILEVYFTQLRLALKDEFDADEIEAEWRALYMIAWADFQRFMLGWNPQHSKITTYSDALTERAINQIEDHLLSAARDACFAVGALIETLQDKLLDVSSQGFASQAGDIVAEIDIQAQAVILERLAHSIETYDLGVLAEEGEDDESRLKKHALWAIDPLDGAQHFVEGCSGYAVSIALVSQEGQSLLGVVYDPAHKRLYQAKRGGGFTLSGAPVSRGYIK